MQQRRFPIGIQDFARLRGDNCIYVDKTDLIHKMVTSSSYYFLSRPRRFGKSLLVSTLQCYFEGRRELFEGLAIEKLETEWKQHPVIRLDMSIVKYSSKNSLPDALNLILETYEVKYGVPSERDVHTWGVRLARIIEAARKQTGNDVVVLVDEYDTPMLDTFGTADYDDVRNQMRNLYSPLKALGGMLRFVFLTGISKFSQLSIFSELNNLRVITMSDEYSAICGITKEELFTQLQPDIQALANKKGLSYDKACAELKRKYDGYHFSCNSADIYNPFSLINALADGELGNYWFSTGTPTMLTKTIKRYNIDPAELDTGYIATLDMFDTPTETAESPIPILYQSGYLTIKDYDGVAYTLGFPNDEVRTGFLKVLMPCYAGTVFQNDSFLIRLVRALNAQNLDAALTSMRAFFSSIPYNAERQDENHYKTVFYLIFRLLTQFNVRTEECSAAGRADALVETASAVYVFEFKLDGNGTAADALRQIDDKGYLIPYAAILDAQGNAKKLYKVGVAFDEEHRTIGEWLIKEE